MSAARLNLVPYLAFDGRCREALNFYAKALQGKIGEIFTYAGTPMEKGVPEEWKEKVMHGSVQFAGQTLMASDRPPGHGTPEYSGVSLSINLSDGVEAERVFGALSDGATITMPLQKTFFAEKFGMLDDQFGVSWMVHCEG